MRKRNSKKGQAIVELAIFGSLILFLFGALLSYMQRLNDQQYAQMETFRRALEKACTYQGATAEGTGASVQYTLLENRRHVDLSSGFRKGSPSNTGYSANVFWAIPKVDEDAEADNLIVYRINEDEKTWNYRNFIPKEHDAIDEDGDERQRYWSFEPDNTDVSSNLTFNEQATKEESPSDIINTKESNLQETIATSIPYSIKEKDKDDENYENVVKQDTLWTLQQGLYRDADGQYKYSEAARDTEVTSQRTWVTGF